MRLHSKSFERELKSRIKQTIRESPQLKKEYKRTKRARKFTLPVWAWRSVMTFVVAFFVREAQVITGSVTTALAAGSLLLTLILCTRIERIWTLSQDQQDVPALVLLPVEVATIFRWQRQKFIRESLFILFDVLIVTGVLAATNDLPLWKWILGLPFAVLVWGQIMIWAVFGALFVPRKVIKMVYTSLVLAAALWIFGRSLVGSIALHLLDENARGILCLLPTGWAISPFETLCSPGQWWLLLLWVPCVFAAFRVKKRLPDLAAHFELREFVLPQPSEQVPDEAGHFSPPAQDERQPGRTIIEEILNSGSYLNQPGFILKYPVERWLWSWLTPREKAVAEFIHPDGITIRDKWKTIFIFLMGFEFALLAGGLLSPGIQVGIFCAGTFMIFCMCLAAMMNNGRAFRPMWMNGLGIPIYAEYGIGFNELSAVFNKYLLIQMPAVLVVFMLVGATAALIFGFPALAGLLFGFKTAALAAGLGFILRVLAFSAGSNDSKRFRFESFLLVFSMLGMGFVFLGLGGTALALYQTQTMLSLLLLAGALLDSYLFWWIYSLFHRHGRFDLMAEPRR